MKAIKVTKENGIITIVCEDGRVITIDCINNTIKSYTNRFVKTFPSVDFDEDLEKYKILRKLRDLQTDKGKNTLSIIETLWNNLEIVSNIPDSLPKGYIKYCVDNEQEINNQSLKKYQEVQKLKNFNDKDKKILNTISQITDITDYSIQDLHNIIKVFHNSLKDLNNIFDIKTDMKTFLKYHQDPVLHKYINYEKTAHYNCKIIEERLDELREMQIATQENRIKDLEKFNLPYYTIIVPTTLAEFTDEGNQQNNCVGYYYHNDIIKGNYLIYFIRNKKDISKSYITCRYSLYSNETVEHRIKYNNWYNDEKGMIKKIDEEIRRILNK